MLRDAREDAAGVRCGGTVGVESLGGLLSPTGLYGTHHTKIHGAAGGPPRRVHAFFRLATNFTLGGIKTLPTQITNEPQKNRMALFLIPSGIASC